VKKVFIGVGIGCGVLLVVLIIAMVAGGLWAKGQFEGAAEGMTQDSEKMQQQEQRVVELNKKYSFDAPPEGQPILLTEERLQDYFAVRAALKPVLANYEERGKQLKQSEGKRPDIRQSFEAYGTLMGMVADVRMKWLDALAKEQMSPREFHAITASVYGSQFGEAMGKVKQNQRAMFEQLKAGLEQQVKDGRLPPEMRAQIQEQITEVQKKIDALPPPTAEPSDVQKIYAANTALLEKYKDQIEQDATRGLDMFLVGGGDELGKAFQDAMDDSSHR
jgi:hypothetical protein